MASPSNAIIYHQVAPDNDADQHTEFNTLDFTLQEDGRKLLPNSVYLDFTAEITTDGTTLMTAERISISNLIGAHAFIESYQVEIQSKGVVENLQDSPRWHASHAAASLDTGDFFTSKYQAEGRQPISTSNSPVLQQVGGKSSTAANHLKSPTFSIKPLICLNRMNASAGDGYAFSKNGYIRVSCNLARVGSALYGANLGANSDYKLKNVQLRFASIPDSGAQGVIMCKSTIGIKSTINSTQASILARVPSPACSGVVVNFLEQSHESSLRENSNALEQFPQFESVEYLMNSSNAQGVSYTIDDEGEAVRRGIEALAEAGANNANSSSLNANKGYIIGQNFEEFMDLTKTKFQMNIQSNLVDMSTSPRLVYMFFQNLFEM
jgi:hypothetical protein